MRGMYTLATEVSGVDTTLGPGGTTTGVVEGGKGMAEGYVWNNRWGNVVPKKAPVVVSEGGARERDSPSTPAKRELGGTYMSTQLGQYSLTVSTPGRSLRPHGTSFPDVQYTRGQTPKWLASSLANWRVSWISTAATHHLLQALTRDDEALVDEAVQELRARLDDGHVGDLVRFLFCRGVSRIL